MPLKIVLPAPLTTLPWWSHKPARSVTTGTPGFDQASREQERVRVPLRLRFRPDVDELLVARLAVLVAHLLRLAAQVEGLACLWRSDDVQCPRRVRVHFGFAAHRIERLQQVAAVVELRRGDVAVPTQVANAFGASDLQRPMGRAEVLAGFRNLWLSCRIRGSRSSATSGRRRETC